MRYYESLYIVNPNYEQGKLDEVMKTVSETISGFGFNPINHFVWERKDWPTIFKSISMVRMYCYTLKLNRLKI